MMIAATFFQFLRALRSVLVRFVSHQHQVMSSKCPAAAGVWLVGHIALRFDLTAQRHFVVWLGFRCAKDSVA
jgi:hypothetical protein